MAATDGVDERRTDRADPTLHVRPAAGWLNDPNGPFRWHGRYHLFFQHNPAAPVHADIHWGHVSSTDLLHWRTEPVALAPTPGHLDAGGCWSGCVVDDRGVPTAVYTAVGDGVPDATIGLATARDDQLRDWRKHPSPAARPPRDLELLGYRDPFVFSVGGHRYALVGAGLAGGGAGTVLLYACDDLSAWTYLGPLASTEDRVAATHAPADIWECPQFFRLGDRWVLIVSLWTDQVLDRVAYLVGDLDTAGGLPRFTPTGGGLVDAGHDFYAPAVLVSPDRILLWGWSWEDRPEADVLATGWAGLLTLPRVLTLDRAGRLVSVPAPELNLLRHSPVRQSLEPGRPRTVGLPSGPSDVEVRLHRAARQPITLTLRLGESFLRLIIDLHAGHAELRRRLPHPTRASRTATARLTGGDTGTVRLLLDGSVAELFLPGGSVFTERLHPASAEAELEVDAPPGARAEVTVWRLRAPVPHTAC